MADRLTDSPEGTAVEAEVIDLTPVHQSSAVQKAAFEVLVDVAARMPRNMSHVLSEATSLCCRDATTAGSLTYAKPVYGDDASSPSITTAGQAKRFAHGADAKNQGQLVIIGPSARFAEILAYSFPNLQVRTVIEEVGERSITVSGQLIDTERRIMRSEAVTRTIWSTKNKRRYSDNQIANALNAAASVALRNVILHHIPRALWEPVWRQAMRTAAGEGPEFLARRDAAVRWFSERGVPKARLLAALGVASVDDMIGEHLVALRSIVAQIEAGEITIEAAFPAAEEPPESTSATPPPGVAGAKARAAAKPAAAVPKPERPKAAASGARQASKAQKAAPPEAEDAEDQAETEPDAATEDNDMLPREDVSDAEALETAGDYLVMFHDAVNPTEDAQRAVLDQVALIVTDSVSEWDQTLSGTERLEVVDNLRSAITNASPLPGVEP